MNAQPWLKAGMAVKTQALIGKTARTIRLTNPEKMTGHTLPFGTPGRIHSESGGTYCVWLLEEASSNRLIFEVPLVMMGQLFLPATHRIFPHLG